MDKAIETFVREKSDGIRHSGRDFYRHLRGTYDLLQQCFAPEYVCRAGLCHSIYGTNAFKVAAVPITTRKEVADLIGEDAERLAYIFCVTNRPSAFIKTARNGPPYTAENRITGEMIELSMQDLYDLLCIEIANLREQNSVRALPDVTRAWRSMKELVHA